MNIPDKNIHRSTRISQHVHAPRQLIYRALLDSIAIATWMVPDGMTSEVHAFEAHENGAFHISLTYLDPSQNGKTTAYTDTFHGRFLKLIPNEKVVEVVEFVTTDPALRGEMTIAYTLIDAEEGTDVLAVHDRLPPGLSSEENETGWKRSMEKLAAYAEADYRSQSPEAARNF